VAPRSRLVRLDSVTVRFGHVLALEGVTLELPERGIVGLVGPNGCGKSTLLDVLSGFQKPTAGRVVASESGQVLSRLELRQRAARLHQVLLVPDSLSSRDYLGLATKPRSACSLGRPGWHSGGATSGGSPSSSPLGRSLAAIGARGMEDSPIGHLSWGQRRVVALLAVLATGKPMLLLDEPLSGLSSESTRAISSLISTAGRDALVVLADHDLESLDRLAERIVSMTAGRVASDEVRIVSGVRVDAPRIQS